MSEPQQIVQMPCCDAWAKAHAWATDNEGYANLVHHIEGAPYIGNDTELPPVAFCPWCGAEKLPTDQPAEKQK